MSVESTLEKAKALVAVMEKEDLVAQAQSPLEKATLLATIVKMYDEQGEQGDAIRAATKAIAILAGDRSVDAKGLRRMLLSYRSRLINEAIAPSNARFCIVAAIIGSVTLATLAYLDFFEPKAITQPTADRSKTNLIVFALSAGCICYGILGLAISRILRIAMRCEIDRHGDIRQLPVPVSVFQTMPGVVTTVFAMISGTLVGATLAWQAVAAGLTHPALGLPTAMIFGAEQGWIVGLLSVYIVNKIDETPALALRA